MKGKKDRILGNRAKTLIKPCDLSQTNTATYYSQTSYYASQCSNTALL